MQAFKAANPHSVLEDFVRWHSPKDWIESSDGSTPGRLSSRMSQPTNIWQELWRVKYIIIILLKYRNVDYLLLLVFKENSCFTPTFII